jgi:hypothetical protein
MQRKARLGFVAAMATLMVALIPALASGYGYDQTYCGSLKGSTHWCGARTQFGNPAVHSWDWNQASQGNVNVVVCERIWVPSGKYAVESLCGYGFRTSNAYVNRTCACYEAHVMQWSGSNRVVWGYAIA